MSVFYIGKGIFMSLLTIGTPAPDFTLTDQHGNTVTLSALRGRRVVVYFYSKDNTPGCTRQACAYAGKLHDFEERGVTVIGISRDSALTHAKFSEKHGLGFILLADPDHTVIEAYGAWQEKKQYGKVSMGTVRSTFIIGADGVIEHVIPKAKPDTDAETVLALLD